MTGTLKGKTLFITGASRGIGLAIALRAAKDGANIVVAAKSAEPHPKLEGTIYTAAEEIEAAGGKALPCVVDVRSEENVKEAVAKAVETFGGIDILVNNASAIALKSTPQTAMSRYDLMHQVNARGTFLCSKTCLPHLRESDNPHILNISPPLNMEEKWFAPHVAYTMAKYGMSLCVLGMAGEFKPFGIGVNALWPRTAIATAAVKNVLGGDDMMKLCRAPEIMSDSAYEIFTRNAKDCTGNFFVDDEVLESIGVSDLSQYAAVPGTTQFMPDFFVDPKE